jgi:hypothetical protein
VGFGPTVLGALAASPASATTGSVSGRLDVRGYEVIAVTATGVTIEADTNAKGRFVIKGLTGPVTLSLRGKDGSYAGPIVMRKKSATEGVMAVKPRTALGLIDVRDGYGLVVHKPFKSHLAMGRTAILKKGEPVGADKLGLVKTKKASGATSDGADADADGVINAFDVDDDGDKLLDNVDSTDSKRGAAAASLPSMAARKVHIFSNLKLPYEDGLNANAGSTAMSKSAVNTAMTSAQTLAISVVPGDEVELDCGALSYCSAGGTGTGMVASSSGGNSFPDDYDADHDTYGTIEKGPTGDFQLLTGATFDKIGGGDTFLELVTAGTKHLTAPGMLAYTFTSTPAITSWTDGTTTTSASYPAATGAEGSSANPFDAQATASGDMVLTFTFWRPQRPRIAPSEAKWVDIGKLGYSIDVPNSPDGGAGPGICPASTLSESDPNLSASGDQLKDAAVDANAAPANTLTLTVNMTDCLGTTATWDVGETFTFDLQARTLDGDNAAQRLTFTRSA